MHCWLAEICSVGQDGGMGVGLLHWLVIMGGSGAAADAHRAGFIF